MGRSCSNVICILALTTLFASPMTGEQSVQGATQLAAVAVIQGRVRDSLEHPIAKANVCLRSNHTQTLTVSTDSAGNYLFSAVPQGDYTLSAEMAGYRKAESALVLGPQNKTVDLVLEPEKTGEQKKSPAAHQEFFDEPHFTVAGVVDTTNLGGHGSDASVRNRDALAGATASLKNDAGSLNDDEAGHHHSLADAAEKQGDPLAAVREYQRAAELIPSEPNLFDWGVELLTHHAAEPAVEVFTKGNRLFPRSVRMLEGLAASWYSLGSYEQAAQKFCEVSDMNPNDPNPYLFMGKMQVAETVASPEVEKRLARFATLQPRNPWANYYYALMLQKRRKSTEDVENLDRITSLLQTAVQLDPKFGLAYLELGTVYAEQKHLSKTILALQEALEADPNLEEAHYRLAQAYKQSGNITKAQGELQLYQEISREKTQEGDRQRHEIQQFVYELRDRTPAVPPQ